MSAQGALRRAATVQGFWQPMELEEMATAGNDDGEKGAYDNLELKALIEEQITQVQELYNSIPCLVWAIQCSSVAMQEKVRGIETMVEVQAMAKEDLIGRVIAMGNKGQGGGLRTSAQQAETGSVQARDAMASSSVPDGEPGAIGHVLVQQQEAKEEVAEGHTLAPES